MIGTKTVFGPSVLLALVMLAGCLPIHETYFEPAAAGARIKGTYCRGGGGPPRQAVFQLDPNLKIPPDQLWRKAYAPTLSVIAWPPRDKSQELVLVIHATDPDDPSDPNDPWSEEPDLFDPSDVEILNPENKMPLRVKSFEHKIYPEIYEELAYHVQINGLKRFLVRLPGFIYQGIRHPPREITFTEKSGVFIAPINC